MADSRRSSVSSTKSSSSVELERRKSIESLKKSSLESLRRSSLSNQKQEISEQGHSDNKDGLSDSYAQSKFSRKRSVQYRNTGWKSSHERFARNDSSGSIKSNQSEKVPEVQEEEVTAPPQISPEGQKNYFQQSFIDIALLLRSAGVNDDLVEMLQA